MKADNKAELLAALSGVACIAAGWHLYHGEEGWYAVPGENAERYRVLPGWDSWVADSSAPV